MIKTFVIASLVIVGLAWSATADAAGRGWRRYGGGTVTTPYAAQSTAGSVRTYSYEPGLAPMATPRYNSPSSRPFSGFHSAGWKMTGER